MITGDILDKQEVDSAIKGKDYVYHFAGIADTSKIRLATGWEPKTLLSQGIKQTLDYMINNPYFVQEID